MRKSMLLIAIVFASGCSDIDRGVVVSKEHHGQWTQINMIFTGKVMIPQVIVHPERWTLNIADSGEHGYCDVSKDRFNKTSIGDYITCKQ